MKFLTQKVVVKNSDVSEFLNRGVEAVFPNKEDFEKALLGGKRIRVYLGIDPTGPTLHLGHMIPMLKLRTLQRLGHEIVLLMGDFTAMIGDPTDKSSARKKLSHKEVLSNLKLYKKQASKVLSFTGKNKAQIKFNSRWLSKMSFTDVLELASLMTVDQMRKRDMFRKREEDGKPIYLHEFLYPLMQGYDSVAMNVDAEIGGNDQTFNMLTGRDLMSVLKKKNKFVLATKLLIDSSGKKMGKTEGNMVSLSDSPRDMFGKVMSWPDNLIIPAFELCTTVPLEEIELVRKNLDSGVNPRDVKAELAEVIVSLYHDVRSAKVEKDNFFKAFSNKEMPSNTPEILVEKGTLISDALVLSKMVSSKSEFKRLVQEGAVRDMKTDQVVEKFDETFSRDIDLRVGKHRFVRLKSK
ncbi:MAG: tyrosine--tRNA ligase [Candidatus Taylorbacteria bacterium CG10_big_fil_rev_8_21_14_0_10_41_48]|uniref:Tyrosine--tRNA ligase n=1 Tax=Candidatus Taylorbacteria bacterium CG10_big_fil_rev_8_21_14_0_10_41_48 TaxID=1975024 RepID=A0A2M8LD38_9BACT|nr:MAG: tyrosine--tRNA ligase [Candidatus Taylorbacteria bacterium CG10_big_fil_rev_8_21_14_0_10_41_48]